MKHHLSAQKGSSVRACQLPLSSDPSRVKTCRADSVSESSQEVRFSFLRLHRPPLPFILRPTISSFCSMLRRLKMRKQPRPPGSERRLQVSTDLTSGLHTSQDGASPAGSCSWRWTRFSLTAHSRSPEPDSGRTSSCLGWAHPPEPTGTWRGRPRPGDSCWPPGSEEQTDSEGQAVSTRQAPTVLIPGCVRPTLPQGQ